MSASLFDACVWVAATFPSHPFHAKAEAVLAAATQDEPALFCRATQMSFLRLATTPQLLGQYGAEGLTNRDALAGLQVLLSHPSIQEREEPPNMATLWFQLADQNSASPKTWRDACPAAFAITAGLRLVTLDKDFKKFEKHGCSSNYSSPISLYLRHPFKSGASPKNAKRRVPRSSTTERKMEHFSVVRLRFALNGDAPCPRAPDAGFPVAPGLPDC